MSHEFEPTAAGDLPHPASVEKGNIQFAKAFAGQGVDPSLLVSWHARAHAVGAAPLGHPHGAAMLQSVWASNRFMQQLESEAVGRMEQFFSFAFIEGNREVILQNEYGDFMVVLLSGSIAVDRVQPWGERLRLAEAQPGELLGEMSLLDGGKRFSACTTLGPCEVAVLSAEAMDAMVRADPLLAANLIALLARKLSLRLRGVSARLSDQTHTQE